MACPKIQKYKACMDPHEIKDFGRLWNDLLAETEIIVVSTWEITCEDEAVPTLIESPQGTGISVDQKATSIFLQGGTIWLVYMLTNSIETLDGEGNVRKYDRSGLITVVEA